MKSMLTVLNNPYLLWLLLALPSMPILLDFITEERYYAQMMYDSGLWSIRLLTITLAVTPLLRLSRRWPQLHSIARWGLSRRRYLGVASFAYAFLHLLVYVRNTGSLSETWAQLVYPEIALGWATLLILLLLAVTSNDASVKYLGRRWKTLHRWVYCVPPLAAVHWWMFGVFLKELVFWSVLFAALLGYRIWAKHRFAL